MHPRRGSTLAELLAALMILAPVLVVVVGLFPYAHSINRRAWALGTAQELARTRMEQLRREPEAGRQKATLDNTEFTVTSRVEPYAGLELERCSVEVRWNDADRFELVSLVEAP